jgi:hypothetical protein
VPEPKKKPVRTVARKTVRRKKIEAPTHQAVAERAYYIALEQGGQPFENWIQAERELAAV